MADTLSKVKPADPLKIHAGTFSKFVGSARDYLQRQQSAGQKPTQAARQAGIVLVEKTSGAGRGRFDVVGINSSVFTPTAAGAMARAARRETYTSPSLSQRP